MERESERSLSENLRRSDREDVKVIEWEEFDHELARLWSLSSALKLTTEKKQSLQPKLDSLIQLNFGQVSTESLRRTNELEDVRGWKQENCWWTRMHHLQESNCQLEGESGYAHLKIVTNKLRKRQQYMISQVSFIYPLKIEAGPSQDQEMESFLGGS